MEMTSRKRSLSPYSGRAAQSQAQKPRQNETKKPAAGFKFKEKPRREENDGDRRKDEARDLPQGDRETEKPRRPRKDPERDKEKDAEKEIEHDPIREKLGASVVDKFGEAAFKKSDTTTNPNPSSNAEDNPTVSKPKKKKDKSSSSGPKPLTEEMIIVNVNDRLGTKAAIPCLASDPIKLFKIQVAQRIGREPHEIMLKRQGERPFKDVLTLRDYGVSNGVQLDLELDTGD